MYKKKLIITLTLVAIFFLSAVAAASSPKGLFGFFGVETEKHEKSVLPMDCEDGTILVSMNNNWQCKDVTEACELFDSPTFGMELQTNEDTLELAYELGMTDDMLYWIEESPDVRIARYFSDRNEQYEISLSYGDAFWSGGVVGHSIGGENFPTFIDAFVRVNEIYPDYVPDFSKDDINKDYLDSYIDNYYDGYFEQKEFNPELVESAYDLGMTDEMLDWMLGEYGVYISYAEDDEIFLDVHDASWTSGHVGIYIGGEHFPEFIDAFERLHEVYPEDVPDFSD